MIFLTRSVFTDVYILAREVKPSRAHCIEVEVLEHWVESAAVLEECN